MKLHRLFLSALSAASALNIPQQDSLNSLVARAEFEETNMENPNEVKPVPAHQPEKIGGPAYGSDEYDNIVKEGPPYPHVDEESTPELFGMARNNLGDRVLILEYTEADMKQNAMANSAEFPDKSDMAFTEGDRSGSGKASVVEIREYVEKRFGVRMMEPKEVFPFALDKTNSYAVTWTSSFGSTSKLRVYVALGTERGPEKQLIDASNSNGGLMLRTGSGPQRVPLGDKSRPINAEQPTQDTAVLPGVTEDGVLSEAWNLKALLEEFGGLDPRVQPQRKRDVMVNIKGASTNQTAKDYQSSYQKYLSAFETAQNKAIEIVFPFLKAFINGTDSNMVYDAAWSIYSELTFAPVQVMGPFTMGLGCMDWFEEKLFNGTNSTVDSIMAKENPTAKEGAMLQAVIIGWELQQAYQLTYNATLAALKSSGVLADLVTLSSYLMPNDTSLIPEYMKQPATDPNTPFFTQWRKSTS